MTVLVDGTVDPGPARPGTSSRDTLGRHGPAPVSGRDHLLDLSPRIISRIAAVLGALAVMDGLLPHDWRALYSVTTVLPSPATAAAQAVVTVSGILLLRISAGLRRRKRAELLIGIVVCAALTLGNLLRAEPRPVEAVVTVVLLLALVSSRSRFTACADPGSRWFAVRSGLQLVAFSLAYGLVLLAVPGHVVGGPSIADRVRGVLWSMVGLDDTLTFRTDHFADVFHATLLGLGLLTICWVVALLLRTAQPVAHLSDDDEARLRVLLGRQGRRDSLAYFALRRDKDVVWSPSGKAAITYRVVCGVALVSGDPIGDPEAWPGAIQAYRRLVDEHGWTPGVMGCSELGATILQRECGLSALMLGDEAVLRAGEFALEGRAMRGVRQACHRVERAGYTIEIQRVRDLDDDRIRDLRIAADSWRGNAVERGFSMALSRLGDRSDPDCVVVTARRDGRVCGLLHFVPWGPDGLSLDLMRRDPTSDNGLNEFMIAGVMAGCADLGVERVSLNFAVFREALERGAGIGAGPVLRLWRRTLLVASRFWQIDSLYRFNSKFRPDWQPRFVSFARARDLPRIATAALEAEAFIVRPQRVKQLLGRG